MKTNIKILSVLAASMVVAGCSSTSNEMHSSASPNLHPVVCAVVGGGVGYGIGAAADASGAAGLASVSMAALAGYLCYDPDSDGDGVADSIDQCPDTPAGAVVDENGCEVKEEVAAVEVAKVAFIIPSQCKHYVQAIDGRVIGFTPVKFTFDHYELSRGMKHHMSCVADVLKEKGMGVELQGNTDNKGTEKYNMWLGEQRSLAAQAYMTSIGVNPSQLSTMSHGEANPSDSNSTDEGRRLNRRVEFAIK